jgi:hypothetical protein
MGLLTGTGEVSSYSFSSWTQRRRFSRSRSPLIVAPALLSIVEGFHHVTSGWDFAEGQLRAHHGRGPA